MSDETVRTLMPPEITIHGARTCEDTAIDRLRLQALGIRFREAAIDADAAGLVRVPALEGRVTPTIVVGDESTAITEPSIEQLEAMV